MHGALWNKQRQFAKRMIVKGSCYSSQASGYTKRKVFFSHDTICRYHLWGHNDPTQRLFSNTALVSDSILWTSCVCMPMQWYLLCSFTIHSPSSPPTNNPPSLWEKPTTDHRWLIANDFLQSVDIHTALSIICSFQFLQSSVYQTTKIIPQDFLPEKISIFLIHFGNCDIFMLLMTRSKSSPQPSLHPFLSQTG